MFLIFSGAIERDLGHKMGYELLTQIPCNKVRHYQVTWNTTARHFKTESKLKN